MAEQVRLRLLESGNKGGKRSRWHNPEEGVPMAANPKHHLHKHAGMERSHRHGNDHKGHRHERHNPSLPGVGAVNRVAERAYGVTLEEGMVGTGSFLLTELGGGMIEDRFGPMLGLSTKDATGKMMLLPAPMDAGGKARFDLVYTIKRAIPRLASGALVFFGFKMIGLKAGNLMAAGVGAAAAAGSQLVASSSLAAPYVSGHSLEVTTHPTYLPYVPPAAPPRWIAPPPSPAQQALVTGSGIVVAGQAQRAPWMMTPLG